MSRGRRQQTCAQSVSASDACGASRTCRVVCARVLSAFYFRDSIWRVWCAQVFETAAAKCEQWGGKLFSPPSHSDLKSATQRMRMQNFWVGLHRSKKGGNSWCAPSPLTLHSSPPSSFFARVLTLHSLHHSSLHSQRALPHPLSTLARARHGLWCPDPDHEPLCCPRNERGGRSRG